MRSPPSTNESIKHNRRLVLTQGLLRKRSMYMNMYTKQQASRMGANVPLIALCSLFLLLITSTRLMKVRWDSISKVCARNNTRCSLLKCICHHYLCTHHFISFGRRSLESAVQCSPEYIKRKHERRRLSLGNDLHEEAMTGY